MKYDIVVVGGGTVGLTAALAFAEYTDLQIALINNKELTSTFDDSNYGYRVSAISPATKKFFSQLKIWESIQAKRISPYKKMYVWDKVSAGNISFDCDTVYEPALGYIVEDELIKKCLLEKIFLKTNLHCLPKISLEKINFNNDSAILQSNALTLQANLIIAADGSNSWIRNQLAIPSEQLDYQHHALVATVQTDLPHQQTARQCFTATGSIAFLPIVDPHQCSIVWSDTPDHIQELLAKSPVDFATELAKSFENYFGNIKLLSDRFTFPLKMHHAISYAQDHIALVGDAAHTLHPLAGLGLNLGIADVACLLQVVIDALRKNRNYVSLATLRRYERARHSENLLTINFVNSLKKLFSENKKLLFRNLGLTLTDQMTFLKNIFIQQAMGKPLHADLRNSSNVEE